MYQIGLPRDKQGLVACNYLNEVVGAYGSAVQFERGCLARLAFEGGVRWHAHYQLTTGASGRPATNFVGGWPHVQSPTRVLAELLGKPWYSEDAPLLGRVFLNVLTPLPSDVSSALAGITGVGSTPLVCDAADSALYEDGIKFYLSEEGKVFVVVQIAMMADRAICSRRPEDLPQEVPGVLGMAGMEAKFPQIIPIGTFNDPERIKTEGPQPEAVVRGWVRAVDKRNSGVTDALRNHSPEQDWSNVTGEFTYLAVETERGLTVDVVCRPQDLTGEAQTGCCIQVQGTASAQLLPDQLGTSSLVGDKPPQAWKLRGDEAEPIDLLSKSSGRPAPNLSELSERLSDIAAELPEKPKGDTPKPRPLLPLMGLLTSLIAFALFFVLTPFTFLFNLWILAFRWRRASVLGRVIASLGLLISALGVFFLYIIIVHVILARPQP